MMKSVPKDSVTVLIVAKPGPLRDSMQALMRAMPQVQTICEVDDLSSTPLADLEGYPDLVLLNCEMGSGLVGPLIEQVEARWPQARCITLVGSVEQQQEAESAGADAVVLSGLPAQKLLQIIAGTLSPCEG